MTRRRALAIVALAILAVLAVGAAVAYTPDLPAAVVAARYETADSGYVEVDGMRVHVTDRGTGPAVVLLHGSNDSTAAWAGWTERLADAGYRVVAIDLPGHGLTGPHPAGRYSLVDQAGFVDRVVTALGIDRFVVGGNSMGGGVAWHLALLAPDRVEGLVLVDAVGIPRDGDARPSSFGLATIPFIDRLLTVVTPRSLVEDGLRDAVADPATVTPAMVDRYHDLLRREGNREATRQRLFQPDPASWSDRIAEIRVPALILWGAQDDWIPPSDGSRFADLIEGARLVVYPGLGHLPMTEDPGTTAADVLRFLDGLALEPRG